MHGLVVIDKQGKSLRDSIIWCDSRAIVIATIGGFVLSVFFNFLPGIMNLEFLNVSGFATLVEQKDKTMLYEIPFLDRMGFVFIICVVLMVIISLIDEKRGVKSKGLEIDTNMFKVNNAFAVGALIVSGILVALYSVFW